MRRDEIISLQRENSRLEESFVEFSSLEKIGLRQRRDEQIVTNSYKEKEKKFRRGVKKNTINLLSM